MPSIQTVGIAGTGLIGAGWAARLMIRGIDVVAYDVSEAAEPKLRAAIDVAWPSMRKLLGPTLGRPGRLTFTTDLAAMAAQAEFIHEAAPEREALKIALFRDLDAVAPPHVVLASSSSGFLPTRLQAECRHPERVLIGHPFNPVYLLPLVETVPGERTSDEAMRRAGAYFEAIGMHVLRLKREIDGYVCDRLQEALWREALHILDKDVASTGDIDNSIVYSAGLRWAFMGSFLTYHLAGGPGGMRDFIKQFDPTLELPWTELRFPAWNEALERRLVEGCEAQADGRSVAEIEAQRNDILVDMMGLFERHKGGAGLVLAREKEAARAAPARHAPGGPIDAPLRLYRSEVQAAWVDYNGHMADAFYLWSFGEAGELLFGVVGLDAAYRAATGCSLYTAETHLNYVKEMHLGDPITVETQLLGLDDKRIHLFHRMRNAAGELVATNEIMLLHVDTRKAKTAPMPAAVLEALQAIWAAHWDLPRPEQQGRVMSVKPRGAATDEGKHRPESSLIRPLLTQGPPSPAAREKG